MTKSEWIGEFFLCAMPCILLFMMFIAKEPVRVLIFMASSFFWLCALLLSGLVWWAVVPLRQYIAFGLIMSVLIQEAARVAFFYVIKLSHGGLERLILSDPNATTLSYNLIKNQHVMALVCNLGFGLSVGLFTNINLLGHLSGPASIGLYPGCRFFFILSGLGAGGMMLLNVAWGIIIFHYLHTDDYLRASIPIMNHLFVSALTLLNKKRQYDFAESFVPMYVSLFVMFIWAFTISGGRWSRLLCFCCKDTKRSADITPP